MTEKKKSSKASKLKNFLATGSIEDHEYETAGELEFNDEPVMTEEHADDHQSEDEVVIEDIIITGDAASEDLAEEPRYEADVVSIPPADTARLEGEIAELRAMIADMASELDKRTTSKEQLKEYSLILKKNDAELADKKFLRMLEQLSVMREDFFKLCSGMNAKLDSFSPKDILSSFEAYGVDLENILTDCGVQIGPSRFERLNTIHQRIVDVIPTDDESMNGMIAERVSDEYEYQGRVLLKERVKIYKFSGNGKTEGDEEK
ncbi:MAG: hypothetical protein LBR42_00875 [Candidatus Methanoplasma sp.]|nr:hypothetical protein [Candidatus Methanoplasma sp.]